MPYHGCGAPFWVPGNFRPESPACGNRLEQRMARVPELCDEALMLGRWDA